MSLPAPGWYADPSNAAAQRYWDGAAWTEHVAPAAGPAGPAPAAAPWGAAPTYRQPVATPGPPVTPPGRSGLWVVVAILVVGVLVVGGAIAGLLIARSDDGGTQHRRPATAVPTSTPAPVVPGGPAAQQADLQQCRIERATVTTAIAAARAASQASGTVQDPGTFLVAAATEFRYYTWTGSSPADWSLKPIGTPPC
jgi:hypothetical protein